MPRNVEMRDRVGGIFNHADSLLYPRTHVNMVEGLLSGGKLALNLLPDALKYGQRFINIVGDAQTTAGMLTAIDDYIVAEGLDVHSRSGAYFIAYLGKSITVSAGHVVSGDDGVSGINAHAAGSTVVLENNDWIMYKGYSALNTWHEWVILNNTHATVVAGGGAGLMSGSDKTKLDGIASSANNYVHPTYVARSVDTDGVEVVDVLTSDTGGHITGAAKRTLPNASQTLPGVMSAADKAKLDGIAAGATTNVGTVTSVNGVAGTGITVTGGPITTSGTLTITNTAPNAVHTGDVTGGAALTIADNAVTNFKLADMPALSIKGNNVGSVGNPIDLAPSAVRAMLNVEDGANAYVHPTQTAISLDLGTNETMDIVTVNTAGHLIAATKQTIRSGTTSQDGLLQLASGTELTTALNSVKAASPVSIKTMIDYFAGMKRYADLATANAASHPDGTIALITVA